MSVTVAAPRTPGAGDGVVAIGGPMALEARPRCASARRCRGVSAREGLGTREAEARLARFRRNISPEVKRRPELAMFLDQFKELPVLLLAGSTIVSMATGGIADGVVIHADIEKAVRFILSTNLSEILLTFCRWRPASARA